MVDMFFTSLSIRLDILHPDILSLPFKHVETHQSSTENEESGNLHAVDDNMNNEGFDISWLVVVSEDLRSNSISYCPCTAK